MRQKILAPREAEKSARMITCTTAARSSWDSNAAVAEEIPLDSKEKPLGKRMLPEIGCNVELTRITLRDDEVWWTLGFESFGTFQTLGKDLCAVAATLAARQPPQIGTGLLASYPSWLKEHVIVESSSGHAL